MPSTPLAVKPRCCHLPGVSVWMESGYSGQPLLLLGNDVVHSCCGVQQDDPLGVSLTLHPIIKRTRTAIPTLALNAWYLNDGMLLGSPEDLSASLHIVEFDGPSTGLHFNYTKSLLFIPSAGTSFHSLL